MQSRILRLFLVLITFMAFSCSSILKKHLDDGRSVYRKADGKELKKKDFIEGYILDSKTRKGIENALVEIKNADMGVGYYKLTTNSSGYFRVNDFIKHIRYTLEVVADGYVTHRTTKKISAGKHEILLAQEGILTGVVRNSAGKALAGVEITLRKGYGYYSRSTKRPKVLSTDGTGEYIYKKLAEYSYLVTFRKDGYITETAKIKKIKKGETFQLPMVMLRPAMISGRITIKGIKSPAINMNVTLKGRVTHSTSTYQDGSYSIEDIKPGNYRITLYHRGFFKISTETMSIREGSQRKNLNFIVKPKPPKISAYTYRYTFNPGTKVSFNMRTFRLEKVKARIYHVPMDIFLAGRTDPNSISPKKMKFKKIREWDESIKNFRPYEWRYQSLELHKALPTGGYCLEVSGADRTFDRKFFTVTSIGIVVKRSKDSILAYVTDLVNNKPIPNTRIIVFDNTPVKKQYRNSNTPYKPPLRIEDLPFRIVHKGKTDKQGIFHIRKKSTRHLTVLALGSNTSYAFCSTGHPYVFKRELNKYFIYTDRPVYRAGDRVHYKVIGKKRGRRFAAIQNRKLYYIIKNIDRDSTIKEGVLRLDSWGTYNSSVKLNTDTNLGEHLVKVGEDPKHLYGVGRFYVEQYRKPEFKIEMTPSREYYVNGDTAEFKVEAKYFFGAPLKGALIRYRFYEKRLRDTDTSYWWEEDYGTSGYYNRIKLEGEKYVDKNGIAVLRLNCGNYPYDRELALEVTAIDKSNISITSRKSVRVGRGAFYIKINPKKNFFADDEVKRVEIKALTHSGKPVSAKVRIKVFRYIWKPWQRVYVHSKKPIFEQTVQTGSKGVGILTLPKKFDVFGEFDIIATGIDRRENTITASRVVWIYSRFGAPIASRFKNLELSVNQTHLAKPREITCLLKSRFSDAYVCLTLEGRDVYESKVVKMKGNVLPVKMNIKSAYAPNLFLTATMQRKRALFTSRAEITLPNPDTSIRIKVLPDKKIYLPGEKATVRLSVTDEKGKPVRADLSLASVDESIFYIRRDHTPKMVNFFYSRISNWVMTNYSYPITLLAGASKGGKVKIRQDFRDTAFWKASIKTDTKGIAKVSFKLPDNLTTWRLTVRGHDTRGRVGEKRKKFLVTQDLIARIGKPRFLVEKDSLNLIGITNSNTKRGLQQVNTEFKANGKTIGPDKKINISLPPYGSSRAYYRITVPEDKKSMKIFFKATADKDAKDALLVEIPIESRGVSYKLYSVGDMAKNKKVVLKGIGDTDDFAFKPSELKISVNPSPIAQMIRATKYLSEYPYGCIEQTINRFIPNLVLKELLKKKGLAKIITIKDLDKKVQTGILRLQNYQNTDGTWGWWNGGRGNEFVTGYVLYSFYVAQSLGFAIDKTVVKQGLKAIERMFNASQKMEKDAKAYLLYIYSLWKKWNNKAFSELIKDEKTFTAYNLSFTIRAMALSKQLKTQNHRMHNGMDKKIREKISKIFPRYLKKLKEMQFKDSRGIYWKSIGSQRWGWQGGNTEVSAHVLSALIDAGDRSPLLSQLVSSITRRGRGDAWKSTKETSTVFFSLCSYLDNIGGGVSGKGDVQFKMDEKVVSSISYDVSKMSTVKQLTKKIKIDTAVKKNRYEISASGSAGADVSFDLTLKGNLYFKEKGLLSFLTSPERSLKSLENGIGLVRRFYSVTRVRDVNNNEYLVPQDLTGKNRIRVGDEILVKVRFRAQDNFEYLVLEDYLPSGFEVINKKPYGQYQPYIHLERWDNRMVYFFSKLKKDQVYEVAYILRAELPGKFIVKPARMECMYEPSIQGWSVPAKFEVDKK